MTDSVDEAMLRGGSDDDGDSEMLPPGLASLFGGVALEPPVALADRQGGRPQLPTTVALAGLCVGQWDAFATAQGVDLHRVPMLLAVRSGSAGGGAAGSSALGPGNAVAAAATGAAGLPVAPLDDEIAEFSD